MSNVRRITFLLFTLGLLACNAVPSKKSATATAVLAAPSSAIACDGTTDDTAAIQAAIDAARVNVGEGRPVELPAGICVVSQTLNIRGVMGLIFRGQGIVATDLRWRGNATSPLLLLDHTYLVKLEDFSITPGSQFPLLAAIRIEQGAGCTADPGPTCNQWSSSSDIVTDVLIRGQGKVTNGVHVHLFDQAADDKNDHHRFTRVQISNYTGAGFLLEGRNAKALVLDGCTCLGAPAGHACVDTTPIPRHGASFYWFGGASTGHTVADFDIGDRNDALYIGGVYSEKSARFLRVQDTTTPNKPPYPITVESVRFATGPFVAADKEVIQFWSAGPLAVRGGRWGLDGSGATPVKFRFEPAATRPTAFVFSNNWVVTTDTSIFVSRTPSSDVSNIVEGP